MAATLLMIGLGGLIFSGCAKPEQEEESNARSETFPPDSGSSDDMDSGLTLESVIFELGDSSVESAQAHSDTTDVESPQGELDPEVWSRRCAEQENREQCVLSVDPEFHVGVLNAQQSSWHSRFWSAYEIAEADILNMADTDDLVALETHLRPVTMSLLRTLKATGEEQSLHNLARISKVLWTHREGWNWFASGEGDSSVAALNRRVSMLGHLSELAYPFQINAALSLPADVQGDGVTTYGDLAGLWANYLDAMLMVWEAQPDQPDAEDAWNLEKDYVFTIYRRFLNQRVDQWRLARFLRTMFPRHREFYDHRMEDILFGYSVDGNWVLFGLESRLDAHQAFRFDADVNAVAWLSGVEDGTANVWPRVNWSRPFIDGIQEIYFSGGGGIGDYQMSGIAATLARYVYRPCDFLPEAGPCLDAATPRMFERVYHDLENVIWDEANDRWSDGVNEVTLHVEREIWGLAFLSPWDETGTLLEVAEAEYALRAVDPLAGLEIAAGALFGVARP